MVRRGGGAGAGGGGGGTASCAIRVHDSRTTAREAPVIAFCALVCAVLQQFKSFANFHCIGRRCMLHLHIQARTRCSLDGLRCGGTDRCMQLECMLSTDSTITRVRAPASTRVQTPGKAGRGGGGERTGQRTATPSLKMKPLLATTRDLMRLYAAGLLTAVHLRLDVQRRQPGCNHRHTHA